MGEEEILQTKHTISNTDFYGVELTEKEFEEAKDKFHNDDLFYKIIINLNSINHVKVSRLEQKITNIRESINDIYYG